MPKAPPSVVPDHHSGAPILDLVDKEMEAVGGGVPDMEDDDERNEDWDLPGEVPAAQTFNEWLDKMLADLNLICTVLLHNQEFQDQHFLDGIDQHTLSFWCMAVMPRVEWLQTGACRVVVVLVSGSVTGLETGRGI
jgi:hypothetical protein